MSESIAHLLPKIVRSREGHAVVLPQETAWMKLAAAETGGQFAVAEVEIDPGFGPPLHVHTLEDELFIVAEGEVEFTVDGAQTVAGPGTVVFGPRHVPHTFKGAGSTRSRFFMVVTGDNFERFYDRWLAALARPDVQKRELVAIAQDHGITFLHEA